MALPIDFSPQLWLASLKIFDAIQCIGTIIVRKNIEQSLNCAVISDDSLVLVFKLFNLSCMVTSQQYDLLSGLTAELACCVHSSCKCSISNCDIFICLLAWWFIEAISICHTSCVMLWWVVHSSWYSMQCFCHTSCVMWWVVHSLLSILQSQQFQPLQ